jgi:hypothetical protein
MEKINIRQKMFLEFLIIDFMYAFPDGTTGEIHIQIGEKGERK